MMYPTSKVDEMNVMWVKVWNDTYQDCNILHYQYTLSLLYKVFTIYEMYVDENSLFSTTTLSWRFGKQCHVWRKGHHHNNVQWSLCCKHAQPVPLKGTVFIPYTSLWTRQSKESITEIADHTTEGLNKWTGACYK